jgi:hypothetical protein
MARARPRARPGLEDAAATSSRPVVEQRERKIRSDRPRRPYVPHPGSRRHRSPAPLGWAQQMRRRAARPHRGDRDGGVRRTGAAGVPPHGTSVPCDPSPAPARWVFSRVAVGFASARPDNGVPDGVALADRPRPPPPGPRPPPACTRRRRRTASWPGPPPGFRLPGDGWRRGPRRRRAVPTDHRNGARACTGRDPAPRRRNP